VRLLRWPLRIVATVLGLALLYAAGVVVGGLIPVGSPAAPEGDGYEIFLQSNGIHVEFVLPANAVNGPLAAAAARLPGGLAPYVAFGWGERDFFLNTPSWADFDLGVGAGALLWQTDVLMRVRPQDAAPSGPDARRLVLSRAQFERLAAFIAEGIYFPPDGVPVTVPSDLYDPGGVFLEGRGTYTLFYTCNEWVNDGLKQAGVRTAAWSPFPFGILWQVE